MTQHSPDGSAAGVQTMAVRPSVTALGPIEFEVFAGNQFFIPLAGDGQAFQFPTQVEAFALGDGPYLQVEDQIVDMADNLLKFGTKQDIVRAQIAQSTEDYD